jgi:hypothetical protein
METYNFDYADGYKARATRRGSNVWTVIMTASNGDESPAYGTLVDAEQWMLRHYHGQATGHHMLCSCL